MYVHLKECNIMRAWRGVGEGTIAIKITYLGVVFDPLEGLSENGGRTASREELASNGPQEKACYRKPSNDHHHPADVLTSLSHWKKETK